jgi:predicted DsbA family dithiol-disulfide isomerase
MEATYFFDPSCPYTWRTSRWLVSVPDVTLHWRAFSLTILSGGDIPEKFRAKRAAATAALRLVEALRADGRDADIGAFYTEIGTRTFEAGADLSDDIVVASADMAGIADAKKIMDDESWDDAVRESHETALASAGPDIGSPVLWIEGAPRAVHGPVLAADRRPPPDEALAIWDAVVSLSRSGSFWELKRGRR